MTEAALTVEGVVRVSDLEGRHYVLEVAAGANYVLAPVGDEAAGRLAACVDRSARVSGFLHDGPSIFMRGPVLRVTGVEPAS